MSEPGRINAASYRRRNRVRRMVERAKHPWPLYKRLPAGGLNAVVNHADGTHDDLGRISDLYVRRHGWKAGTQ